MGTRTVGAPIHRGPFPNTNPNSKTHTGSGHSATTGAPVHKRVQHIRIRLRANDYVTPRILEGKNDIDFDCNAVQNPRI